MARQLLLVALIAAVVASASSLDGDACALRANLDCARQGCKKAIVSDTLTDGCAHKCTECEHNRVFGVYMASHFESPVCEGDPVSIDSGATSSCNDKEFVSCSSDACFVQNYTRSGCLEHSGSKVFQRQECTPDGNGGAVVYEPITTPKAEGLFNWTCPSKDVNLTGCAEAIANCVSACSNTIIGGWGPCIECIAGQAGKNGASTKTCCQTVLHILVWPPCKWCDALNSTNVEDLPAVLVDTNKNRQARVKNL